MQRLEEEKETREIKDIEIHKKKQETGNSIAAAAGHYSESAWRK